MTALKLGIDNGNYNTKSSVRMLYASGFTGSDREFITNDIQLFYEGTYYAVGGKRMSFQQDKTKEDDIFILSLPAIAHAIKRAGILSADIILVVGLPVDIFGSQKEAFRKYFLRGKVSFSFEGESYCCFIMDCKVFAQGHAALCKYYSQLKGCAMIVNLVGRENRKRLTDARRPVQTASEQHQAKLGVILPARDDPARQ